MTDTPANADGIPKSDKPVDDKPRQVPGAADVLLDTAADAAAPEVQLGREVLDAGFVPGDGQFPAEVPRATDKDGQPVSTQAEPTPAPAQAAKGKS